MKAKLTKDQWITLILIPFKVYVVIIVPFYLIFRIMLDTNPLTTNMGENVYKLDETVSMLIDGYVLCAPCLLLGAVLQIIAGNFKPAIQTLVVAAVPTSLLLFTLFIAVISHLL